MFPFYTLNSELKGSVMNRNGSHVPILFMNLLLNENGVNYDGLNFIPSHSFPFML